METREKHNNFGEYVMIIACIVSILKNMMDSSEIFKQVPVLSNIFLAVFIVCVGYKLLIQKYNLIKLLLMVVLGLICAYSCFVLKYYTLFYSYIFIIALQRVNILKLIKASIITIGAMIAFHVVAYMIVARIQPEWIVYVYRNGIERQSFFMGHPNLFTAYLAWASLEAIYLYFDKLKGWHLLFIWALNIGFYFFTNSNTGTVVVTLIIILVYLDKKNMLRFNQALKFFSSYGYLIFSLIFTFLAAIYTHLSGTGKVLWNNLNEALTGRLLYGAYAFDQTGFTIFGRQNSFPLKSYWRGMWMDSIYFDNSYFEFLFELGAVYLIIFSIALIYVGKRASNIERIMLCAYVLYCVMEGYIINVFICFPLMLIGKYIYDKQLVKKSLNDSKEVALWKQS